MRTLKYKQRESKPNKFVELFGMKTIVYQSGTVDYDQEEEVEDSKVGERITELKSFGNRSYHTFTIN